MNAPWKPGMLTVRDPFLAFVSDEWTAEAIRPLVAEQGWSVREVEHRAQQFAAGKVPVNGKKAKLAKAAPQPDIASLETELSESLGTRVTIAHGRGGKGKLIIQYTDLDTLDGVLERLRTRA